MSLDRVLQEVNPTVPGFTSPKVLGLLHSIVLNYKPKTMVEIGSYMGRSACVYSSALHSLGGADRKLFCVDIFQNEVTEEYLKFPLVRQIMDYAADARPLYEDLSKISTIGDCFDVTVNRFPTMQQNVTKVKSESAADWNTAGVKFDMSYIDGDHSYEAARADTLRVLGYSADKHVVVFDDYSDQFPGVIQFVEEFRKMKSVEFIAFEHPDIAFTIGDPEEVLAALS